MKVAEVCVVFDRKGVNGPPLSEMKTSYAAMPEPPVSSLPDQRTVKAAVLTAGRAATVLAGGPASMVFVAVLVANGALVSNTMDAWAVSNVPVASDVLERTEYVTLPSPRPVASLTGRNPSKTPSGNWPVAGSIDRNTQVTTLLENQAGQLAEVADKLANAGVNLHALYVVGLDGDLVELAVAVDDPKKAKKALA